ncbi:MAG TPA: cysteine desulfurase family protein [Intrasporangium sp.]|uniref:cysteine desulfurase family protein n=1 Tax=Intrasporangium sp. TaxID=1925024 RepID=UPI002D774232|nr:cysteine desulfurase family protein [Intrasporangium sp.]HET7399376.1 cysteine desulfurase family protein [Intrasporangium sp.]
MTAYLDHAATTPMFPEALAAMTTQLAETGNPSSLHHAGRRARRAVEESRERIATAIGARPSEVVFTSGGTEADNLAVKGTFLARRDADPDRVRVLVPATEHHAVLDSVGFLVEHEGAQVTWLEVTPEGFVDPETVRAAIATDPASVALVSVLWAGNEIGVVQDVPAIAAIAAEHGIPVHTDAVQAVGHVPVDFSASGVDLLSMTGHKLGGPVGVGALVARRDATLVPLSHGGGQERQLRSGTLDAPAIVGFAAAAERAVTELEREATRLGALRDALIEGAMALEPGIRPSGHWQRGDVRRRLPGNAHLVVPGCDGDSLLYLLDAAGIACSTGSACQAGLPQPSHVLLALGVPESEARGALRLTLGHTSTADDVSTFLRALPGAVSRARRAREATAS